MKEWPAARLVNDPLTGDVVAVTNLPEPRRNPALPDGVCGFCPGFEDLVGVETYRVTAHPQAHRAGGSSRWSARSFRNLFPLTEWHEVLCFSPVHDDTLRDLSDSQMEALASLVSGRLAAHQAAGARYGGLVANHGPASYASVEHPHAHALSWPLVPSVVEREAARLARGGCALCRPELRPAETFLVAETQLFTVWCPPWARRKHEMLVVPRSHGSGPSELHATLYGVRAALRALEGAVPGASFNVAMHRAPAGGDLHLHAHVQANLAKHVDPSGYATGLHTNRGNPADDAAQLRAAWTGSI